MQLIPEKEALTIYTDIAFKPGTDLYTFGWCYVVLADGQLRCVKAGAKTNQGHCKSAQLEQYPKDLARRRYGSWAELTFMSDYPSLGEIYVGKQDPWHLVAHFAAKFRLQRRLVSDL
jgi:hypothetical protein